MDVQLNKSDTTQDTLLLAIDIGAGFGAKIGLFANAHQQIGETALSSSAFCQDGPKLAQQLVDQSDVLLKRQKISWKQIGAVGIASPGLFKSDGTYQLAANLPFLNHFNLPTAITEITGLPAGIENDANAGGLAEWSVLQVDLLYWVFGGGWGGAWISKQGEVMYPCIDWDGNDEHLHYTNEPGYSIPLEKWTLRTKFYEFGCSFDRFERIAAEDIGKAGEKLTGPGDNPDYLRAETILSGPGRCRLFRAMVADDDFYERFLDLHETDQLSDPSIAGKHISKLSQMRVEAAVQTDRLFGRILAIATHTMIRQARQDGLPEGVPICLGGKPSYALPYFGPSAQGRLGAMGVMSYLRPSVIDERGFNANLVGAAVLAEKVYRQHLAAR